MPQTLYLLVSRSSENFAQITLSFHDISLLSLPLLASFPNGQTCTRHSLSVKMHYRHLCSGKTAYFMPITNKPSQAVIRSQLQATLRRDFNKGSFAFVINNPYVWSIRSPGVTIPTQLSLFAKQKVADSNPLSPAIYKSLFSRVCKQKQTISVGDLLDGLVNGPLGSLGSNSLYTYHAIYEFYILSGIIQ